MVQLFQAQKGTGRERLNWRAFCATEASASTWLLRRLSQQGAQLQVPVTCSAPFHQLSSPPELQSRVSNRIYPSFPSNRAFSSGLSLHLTIAVDSSHSQLSPWKSDSLRTEVSPSDAGRAQHLQATVTSTQISSKHHLKSAAVLQLVKGTLRQLHGIQRGMNHCHNTATCSTCDLIFYCSESFVWHHSILQFLPQTHLPSLLQY